MLWCGTILWRQRRWEELQLNAGGNRELIQRLLKVAQERVPLFGDNLQMGMRVRHRLVAVFLWAACGPADHLGHRYLNPAGGTR